MITLRDRGDGKRSLDERADETASSGRDVHLEDMLDGGGEVEIEDESLASEESSDAPRREIPRHLKSSPKICSRLKTWPFSAI